MATTGYTWLNSAGQSLMNNGSTVGNQLRPAIAANAAGTRYFGAWTTVSGDADVKGRFINSDGTPTTNEGAVSPIATQDQIDASLAALANGQFIATYTDKNGDPGGDIRAHMYTPIGLSAFNFALITGASDDNQSDVTALADGGFAVSWTRDLGAGNNQIMMSVFNADGSVRRAADDVNVNANNTSHSSIAGLAGGKFVVAWEEQPAAGGDSEVYFRRFDAAGNALDGSDTAGVLLDTAGSINRDIQVAGLPDGGFVVAYEDNGWNGASDITASVYNADGTARRTLLHVNSAANAGNTAGAQDKPTLAVLPNGYFVVGWLDGSNECFQIYDSAGNALDENSTVAAGVVENEIAALSNGVIADVRRSNVTDGSGGSTQTQRLQLIRIIEGNSSDEVLIGPDDTIPNYLFGLEGNDVLEGKAGYSFLDGGVGFDYVSYSSAPGGVTASLIAPEHNTGAAAGHDYSSIEGLIGSAFNDTLAGNSASNVLIGGLGDDTALFAHDFNDNTVIDFGAKILVIGPDGFDTLSGIEHLQFADTTITPVDDGNPLFDTLYYLSRNADVFHAGANALDHFNAFGRLEGRDPNPLFDTSGYLAVNKDVAASGANPLDHYHQTGWQKGYDPSAGFDTTLYLIRNPDVAAAGVDPLAHFLQFGWSEGRVGYAAVGPTVEGFDAQFYLFHNPDVAAAGVDALAHFNQFGWHEGRNPNGWFNTAGYLAHYADVAAAGVNPLGHYEQSGWHEGRDPSAQFDTLGYLAANPDVAAAGVNPLDHYLTSGIYEGRQAVNDGVWH